MPSARGLAAELGCARGTVDSAFARLAGEGWLTARGPAGTFVTEDAQMRSLSAAAPPAAPAPSPPQSPSPSPSVGNSARRPRDSQPEALRLGLPALDAFPRKLWSRLVARHARMPGSLDRPDPAGHGHLRSAIAAYLGRSRGVVCATEQVFVVPAYPAALSLVSEVVLRPGDAAWVESPSYPTTARVLARAGARIVPVPVDDSGMDIEEGQRRCASARLAVVTPSHQSPMGVALALPRRMALLDWAHTANAYIVEDDYDGEYRYSGHPLPALQSLDSNGRVIYVGTFSKVLFPGLRLGYVVVPAPLVDAFRAQAECSLHVGCPELFQAVVAEFLEQGHFARHVRKMRALYAKRRNYLVKALGALGPDGLTVAPGQSGMHVLIESNRPEPDTELARRANEGGFAVQALSSWALDGLAPQGLLAGFTNVVSEAQAKAHVRGLRRAIATDSKSLG